MRKFLIATHGNFASGIKSSIEIIIGQVANLYIIEAYTNGNKSIEEELNEILKNIAEEDELIVFSDLLGGSITNQVLQFALRPNVHVVSGISLPLLVDIIMADMDTPVDEVIGNAISLAREQMVYVNSLIHSNKEQDIHD
jgi:fructoselysine and glucoselysine-specific PTS system IIA component